MSRRRELLERLARPRLGRMAAAGFLLLVAVRTLLVASEAWPYDTDDAFITLRYARNWAAGHGIVWNVADPPVEGYSNFLSLALARGCIALGVDPLLGLKAIGAAALAATGVLVYLLARRLVGPLVAAAAVVLLMAHPGQILWSVTGLETSLYTALVVAAFHALARATRTPLVEPDAAAPTPAIGDDLDLRWLAAAGGYAFLASLARAEGPLVAIAIGAVVVGWLAARRRGRALVRAIAVLALAFALPYLVYFAWRGWYFDRLLPNSVLCKSGFAVDPWRLVREFWDDSGVLVALSLCAPWRRPPALSTRGDDRPPLGSMPALPALSTREDDRPPAGSMPAPPALSTRGDDRPPAGSMPALRPVHVAIVLLAALYVAILHGANPVLSFWIRYFLPVRALLVVTACAGLVSLGRLALIAIRRPAALRAAHLEIAALAVVLLWTGTQVEGVLDPVRARVRAYASRTRARVELAGYLKQELGPRDWYVIGDAGLVPYLTDGYVLDAFCLNNPAMTRPPIDRDVRLFVDDMFARAPAFIAVHSAYYERLAPRTDHDGVFLEIARRSDLAARYRLDRVFGSRADRLNYWLFRRKD